MHIYKIIKEKEAINLKVNKGKGSKYRRFWRQKRKKNNYMFIK